MLNERGKGRNVGRVNSGRKRNAGRGGINNKKCWQMKQRKYQKRKQKEEKEERMEKGNKKEKKKGWKRKEKEEEK